MADEELLTITMEGSEQDGGHVRLNEFVEELEALKAAFKNTERLITGSENSLIYKIVDVSHNSPLRVKIGAVPKKAEYSGAPKRVFRTFATSLRIIQQRKRLPHRFDRRTAEAYAKLSEPLKKNMSRLFVTEQQKKDLRIGRDLDETIGRLLSDVHREQGSILGMLEHMNVHNSNRFTIYPTIGPKSVSCTFPARIRQKVLDSAGKYVRVSGWALYDRNENFPRALQVTDIERFESFSKLSDIRGIAPDATGGEAPEDFVRDLRDGSW